MAEWQYRAAGIVRWLAGEGLPRLLRPGGPPPSPDQARGEPSAWWGADPRWYPGGTPPRRHNRVTPLVDGACYFSALHEALAASRSYVYIAAWCLSPDLPLLRDDPQAIVASRLLPVLAATARRVPVRILLWNGAPLLYHPDTSYVRRVAARFARAGGDLQCRLDSSARFMHTHHQKAIVIDGQVAFVGGMDLTTCAGDRWDTSAHPLRSGVNWHDVQLRIEGESVADVEANFRQRWVAVTGDATLPHREPAADPAWQTPVQIARTIPHRVYTAVPDGEFGIRHAYLTAIAQARRLIYLENQYLWSPEIMEVLTAALRRPRSEPFRVVLVLPAHAGDGRWDNDKHVRELRAAAGDGGRLAVYTLYTSGPTAGANVFAYRPIYVHAKVAIIDDEWLTVGSANLNTRGLRTDGEINAVVQDAGLARALRAELWGQHLGLPQATIAATDPLDLVDRVWPEQARLNARLKRAHRRPLGSAVLPYTPGVRPTDWVLEDVQSLTFDR